MKIAHFAVAALLSLGSVFGAVEPVAAAMPVTAAPAVATTEKTDVVQVRHRDHRRHWRHEDRRWRHGWRHERRHWRPWHAERRWREHRGWRHHQRPHRQWYYRTYL